MLIPSNRTQGNKAQKERKKTTESECSEGYMAENMGHRKVKSVQLITAYKISSITGSLHVPHHFTMQILITDAVPIR